jgi:hypothetical protein
MSDEPITIKKYPSRQLCNPGAARLVTLGEGGTGIANFVLQQNILERAHHG